MLVEGSSMRSTARVVGTSFGTVNRLLVSVGEARHQFHNEMVDNVDVEGHHLQGDELWAFIYAKDKNIELGRVKGSPEFAGSSWTWVIIDSDTKLILSWKISGGKNIGDKTNYFADDLMQDLASRIVGRAKITTDGLLAYDHAVWHHLRQKAPDYVQLVKEYGTPDHLDNPNIVRYKGATKKAMIGDPVLADHNTSIVERFNPTTRMSNRRFTRKTNAFLKKALNHILHQALMCVWYNWIRPHMTLTKASGTPTTPAMAAGLTDRLWTWGRATGQDRCPKPQEAQVPEAYAPKGKEEE